MKAASRVSFLGAGALIVGVVFAGPLLAGPERIAFPEGFDTDWVLYNQVDRPDRKRVRLMYVKPEADATATPGEPAPNGTVLVMADKNAKLDADGNPVLDAEGRLIAEGDFTAIFVMEKQEGWGETVGLEVAPNGDWDYASFLPDGTLNPETKTAGCFACHTKRTGKDFTFTYFQNVADRAD
jgi:hypothetical protein